MTLGGQIFIEITVILVLAYMRAPKVVWVSVIAAMLGGISYYLDVPWVWLIVSWVLFTAVTILFCVPIVRQDLISIRTLRFIKKSLPPISETERIALEAGDTWWEADLFQGRPKWKKLLAMPKPTLSEDEQAFLDNQVEELCKMLDDWEIIQNNDLSPKVWDYLKKEKFFGMSISPEYGGLGFSALLHSAVLVKIATRSLSAAVNTMVPNSLGPAELLTRYGTKVQKEHYLPRLAAGKEIPCFALTGPQAGSDAGAIPDMGVVCHGMHDGKKVIGIKLNFDKRYITLAPIATLLGLAFKLYDPDNLLSDKKQVGITLAIIPTSHPGIEYGKRHAPLGMAFMNGPIRGKDVFIPVDWIIGGKDRAGDGWRMLMDCLAVGRSISLPALSSANGMVSHLTAGAYAKLRKQFKLPIGKFEGVEEALGRIGGYNYLLEATRLMTVHAVDMNVQPAIASAIAKYHLTEAARKITNDAMDIHGGRAIQFGPRNYLGNAYLGLPIGITVEGANILTRNLIIFGQGAMRCHPYLRDEIDAAMLTDQLESLKKFDKLLTSHIGYTFSNLIRLILQSFSAGRLLSMPVPGETSEYYQKLTRMSTALSFVSDLSMLFLGGELKRRERLSARLGDVLSHLYLSCSILKYYEDQGRPAADLPYVHWSLKTSLYEIQNALDDFFRNFANPIVGRLLRWLVFPYGTAYKKPVDSLSREIAQSMQDDCETRSRLTNLCYVGNSKDPIGRLEHAFKLQVEAEPVEKKLHSILKTIDLPYNADYFQKLDLALKSGSLLEQEAAILREAERARLDVLQVDEFEFDHFSRKQKHGEK